MTRPTDDELEAMAVLMEDWVRVAAMLRACKGRVRVKPLEWYESPDDDTDYCADALGLTYVVDCDLDGLCSWGFFRQVRMKSYDDDWDIEAAKAAAQADYEARILAALEPAPDHAEWDAAIEAAAKVADVKPRKGGRPLSGPHHQGVRDGRAEAARLIRALKKGPPHD